MMLQRRERERKRELRRMMQVHDIASSGSAPACVVDPSQLNELQSELSTILASYDISSSEHSHSNTLVAIAHSLNVAVVGSTESSSDFKLISVSDAINMLCDCSKVIERCCFLLLLSFVFKFAVVSVPSFVHLHYAHCQDDTHSDYFDTPEGYRVYFHFPHLFCYDYISDAFFTRSLKLFALFSLQSSRLLLLLGPLAKCFVTLFSAISCPRLPRTAAH